MKNHVTVGLVALALSFAFPVAGFAQDVGGFDLNPGQKAVTDGDHFQISNMSPDEIANNSGVMLQMGKPGGDGNANSNNKGSNKNDRGNQSTFSKSVTTAQGVFSNTGGIAAIDVSGGKVTVNVVTGVLTFTPTGGRPTTITAGNAAVIQGGAVQKLMKTTEALSQNTDSAFSQVVEQSLIQTVAGVAAIAKLLPGNTQVSSLLTNIVKQATQLAATSPNAAALVTNIVGFAVANAPAGDQAAIVAAANSGIANSNASATVKGSLNNVVTTSAIQGQNLRDSNSTPSTPVVGPSGTVTPPIDPSQIVISPSS